MPALRPERRIQVLRYIRTYHRRHGWAPTMQEIGDHVGIGVTSVGHWLRRLEREGMLAHLHNQARTYRPTLKGIAFLIASEGRETLLSQRELAG